MRSVSQPTANIIPLRRHCDECGKQLPTHEIKALGRTRMVTFYAECGCAASRAKLARLNGEPKREPTQVERYRAAGIPPEYSSHREPCGELVAALRQGRGVWIQGPNGTRKTTLAASVAMSLVDNGARVEFANVARALREVQCGFDSGGTALWERLCTTPYLVLDDLGNQQPTEWATSMLYTLAEARHADSLPTLVTTNYDGGALIGRLAPGADTTTAQAVVSRLRGGALVVNRTGPDTRLQRHQRAALTV